MKSVELGPNGFPLCKRGHERSPENVSPNGTCRICARMKTAQYREDFPDRVRETNRRYEKENPDKKRAWRARTYQANKDKERESCARYQKANPDKVKVWQANYREKHYEKVRIKEKKYRLANLAKFRLVSHNRRAKEKEVGGKLSSGIADKLLTLQKGKCRICKVGLTGKKYHLDHIVPIAKGGPNIDSNIQILCPSCNCKKSAKLPHIHAQELGMLFL